MGMERSVVFAGGAPPTWEAVRERLDERSFAVQMRMIDGELAFPDEQPPPTWKELRLGTPLGMVTLRREADRFRVVTWGNADVSLLRAWNAIAWACARAGDGRIEAEAGPLTAAEFAARNDLPFAPTS